MKKTLMSIATACALCAGSALAVDWTYGGGYMTNALGWKIQASATGTELATVDNGGMVKGAPAVPDHPDGTYTLDLSGTITDAVDPGKTYSLVTIGYYAFNGCSPKIGQMILPDTLRTWKTGAGAMGVFAGGNASVTNFLPVDFTLDIVWGAGTFVIGAFKLHDELHLNGVTQTGNTGLTFTHNGIQRIFFYSMFATIHSTTFANSGSTRYDLYFRGNVPGGIADTSYSPGNRSLLHLPGGNASWTTWLASNARAFAVTDVATFESKFPGFPHPAYVVTVGKFKNGYATWWNAAPGITVTSATGVGAEEITPAYGEYPNLKTGTQVAFSAPERVEEDGVSFVCEGYTLETAGPRGTTPRTRPSPASVPSH